jgi:hypothetical protein
MPKAKKPVILVIQNPLHGYDIVHEETNRILSHSHSYEDAVAKALEISLIDHTKVFVVKKSRRIPLIDG